MAALWQPLVGLRGGQAEECAWGAWLVRLLPQDPLRAKQEETGEASALGTGVWRGVGCPPGAGGAGSADRRVGRVRCPPPPPLGGLFPGPWGPLPLPHVLQSLPHPLALSHTPPPRNCQGRQGLSALCSILGLPRFPPTITEQGQEWGSE